MGGYKIEFADVRLTPEQLKKVEEKINSLEEQLNQAETLKLRMVKFVEKFSKMTSIDPSEISIPFTTDNDYDIMFEVGMGGTKIRFREL